MVGWPEAQGTVEARRGGPHPDPRSRPWEFALKPSDSGRSWLPEISAENLSFALSRLWVSIWVKNHNWLESRQKKPEFQAQKVLLWFRSCLKR